MKVVFSFSKSYALSILLFLLITFFIMSVAGNYKTYTVLENEYQREAYVENYGFLVDEPVTVKEITDFSYCPKFSDFYGKTITEYTYNSNDKYFIRLFMFDNILAGADYIDLNSGTVNVLDGEI